MTTKVIIPKAGMGTTEGPVAEWHKAEGDKVEKGELLVEIEAAKSSAGSRSASIRYIKSNIAG